MRKNPGMVGNCCRRLAVAALALSVLAVLPVWARQDEGLVTVTGVPGIGGADGMGDEARFAIPLGLNVNGSSVLIADTGNSRIRSWHGNRVVTVAGSSDQRNVYGMAVGAYKDGSASVARLNNPADCLYLGDDRIAVADRDNHAVRIITPSWVYTLAGTGEAGYQERSGSTAAQLSMPSGLALDQAGVIYVADTGNHCIRRITKSGATSLAAGIPGQGGMADGAWKEAQFLEPEGVAVASDGTIYVADTGNQRICRIRGGKVTTIAGGSGGTYLDTEYRQPGYRDGAGGEALFYFPRGLCVAGSEVLVADTGNHVIRAISEDGTVRTIAGCGEPGFRDGAPLEAELNSPTDVQWEDGYLYIVDSGNSAIRRMRYRPAQQDEELLED